MHFGTQRKIRVVMTDGFSTHMTRKKVYESDESGTILLDDGSTLQAGNETELRELLDIIAGSGDCAILPEIGRRACKMVENINAFKYGDIVKFGSRKYKFICCCYDLAVLESLDIEGFVTKVTIDYVEKIEKGVDSDGA